LTIIVLAFVIRRFGINSATVFLVAFLFGYLSMFLKSGAPTSANRYYLVIDAKSNYLIAQSGLFRAYVYCPDHRYQFGDIIRLSGSIEGLDFSHIEGQFEFEKYLAQRGVVNQIQDAMIIPVFQVPWRIVVFKDKFLGHFDDKTAVYLKALVFGEREYEEEAMQRLEALNLVHLLNVSGLLVYMVLRFIRIIMARFVAEEKVRRYSFIVLLPWLLLIPNSVVLWRIIGGGIINFMASHDREEKLSYWNKKGLLGVIMLLVSKYLVYNPSFYLSFGLGGFLYLVKKPSATSAWWRRLAYRYLPTVILLPYLIINYGAFSVMGIVLLLPLIYIHGFILVIGLFQVFILAIPFLIKPFVRLSDLLLDLGGRPTIEVDFPVWSWIEVCLYLSMIVIIIYLSAWAFRRLFRNAVTVLATFMIFQAIPVANLYRTAVYFINVGQGDAILIQNRNQAVLIDTGGSLYIDVAEVALVPFFKRHGIDKIDTVIITHDDYDHDGALDSLTQKFKVAETVTDTRHFPLTRAGITFSNLNANADQDEDNAKSLVLYFHFGTRDWLLMGDAPVAVEERIILDYPDLKADYLKIGHHGADTSTSWHFLEHVQPSEAIISVGRNYYGHPSAEVLARLHQAGIIIRRTDVEGTIAYI
jgi:competence protein ComEC